MPRPDVEFHLIARRISEYPTVFAKYANCVIGPGEPIVIPRVTSQVDYEGELAAVIGRRARDVAEDAALSYVAGYAPFNDVSARDYQHRTSQWTIGKTFDTFGPLGPALVTADEVGDPHTLALKAILSWTATTAVGRSGSFRTSRICIYPRWNAAPSGAGIHSAGISICASATA